jgi:hypothetical protein
MGTPAMIGHFDKGTNKVIASYCHFDGYVDGVGATLVESYNTELGAQKVAYGGYLSSLTADHKLSRANSAHNDRPETFNSVEEYLNEGPADTGAHYLYLWDGDIWYYAPRNGKFEEVEMNLKGAK